MVEKQTLIYGVNPKLFLQTRVKDTMMSLLNKAPKEIQVKGKITGVQTKLTLIGCHSEYFPGNYLDTYIYENERKSHIWLINMSTDELSSLTEEEIKDKFTNMDNYTVLAKDLIKEIGTLL